MSQYLNIYIKVKGVEKPLFLTDYSRSSDTYNAMWENIPAIPYNADGKTYKELTHEETHGVGRDIQNDIAGLKHKIENRNEALSHITDTEALGEALSEIDSLSEYELELQATLREIGHIAWLVDSIRDNVSIGIGEVEKVLINIG